MVSRRVSYVGCVLLMALICQQNATACDDGAVQVAPRDAVLTMVDGLGALKDVVQSTVRQKEVQLTPLQVSQLKQIAEDEKLFSRSAPENEASARDQLLRFLTIPQQGLLRKAYLKRRFAYPLDVFRSPVLNEIGLSETEEKRVRNLANEVGIDTFETIDHVRLTALNAIVEKLSVEQQDVFWQFFGRNLVIFGDEGDWKSIAVFPEASVERQLNLALVMFLPKNIQLTDLQRTQLEQLQLKVHLLDIKSAAPMDTSEMSAQLDICLTKPQRFALVQRMQQQMLRNDLLVAIRPEILSRLQLDDLTVEKVKQSFVESNRLIKKKRVQLELENLREILAAIPLDYQRTVEELLAGVWVDK